MSNMIEKQCDVAIIGGGLGGLVAGALLAKKGKKVILIEQHHSIGGCASTFNRSKCTIEVSLHEMDGLDRTDIKTLIFRELKVLDCVKFIKLPEVYSVHRNYSNFIFPTCKKLAIQKLVKEFPKDEFGINEYFSTVSAIRKAISLLSLRCFGKKYCNKKNDLSILSKYSQISVGEYLDSIIHNEWLKLILLANISYYHDDPYTLSFIYFCIAQESYYNGSWYIEGGSQQLSNHFADIIMKNEGKIITKYVVTDILIENGVAVGIKCVSSKKNKDAHVKISSQYTISNTSFCNVEKMLPIDMRVSFMKNVKSFKESCSCTSIYLIFKTKIPSEIIDSQYNVIIYPKHINCLKELSNKQYNDKIINFVYYSQVDPTLSEKTNKTVGTITVVDDISHWDNLTSEEYEQQKKTIAQILIKRVDAIIPLSDFIENYEVATPKTIEKFTLNPKGAIYGFSQIPKQSGSFRPKNETEIPNLYMASAWTNPGGGFSGAIISGFMCANKILKIK